MNDGINTDFMFTRYESHAAGLQSLESLGAALLAQYDRKGTEGEEVQREWVNSLPIDQIRPLAVALGRRTFAQMEEAKKRQKA